MSALFDNQLGYIRRALQGFLEFVPEPPPNAGPGEKPKDVIQEWCRRYNARDLSEVGEAWEQKLEALGAELFRADLADRVRECRPAEEFRPVLMIRSREEQARAALRNVVDLAEGRERWRRLHMLAEQGRPTPIEDRKRATALSVDPVTHFSGFLANLFGVDPGSFHAFTDAISAHVERVLGNPGPEKPSGDAPGAGTEKEPPLTISAGDAAGAQADTRAELSKVERALILLTRDPNQSDRAVAKNVPCDPALLSRSDKYQRLRQALAGSMSKGTKSKQGDLEANADE